jgi:hypothetical protein
MTAPISSNPDAPFLLSAAVRRFDTNPLIGEGHYPLVGDNINGPSVIRVPEWLPRPLGRYYMYFAHHSGAFIRLAYADSLAGPWRIFEPGTLHIDQAAAFHNHIASPDVHVDHRNREVRMYFHAPARGRKGQWTGVATSADGLRFTAGDSILGKFYFRVWRWREEFYALAKNDNEGWGELYRSADGLGDFRSRGNFLAGMRHCAVLVRGDHLIVFYSRVGDAPERILATSVDMRRDWTEWRPSEPVEVLRPSAPYEGVGYPLAPSTHGAAVRVQELRDPCVFEEDGKLYLFYTAAGETAIAGGRCELQCLSPAA